MLKPGMPCYTRHTLDSPDVFFEDLGHVHECGFVFDEQEFEEGINSVAALVLDQDGLPIAAAAAGPAYRLTRERMSESAPLFWQLPLTSQKKWG